QGAEDNHHTPPPPPSPLAAVQAAFNQWREESGRPLCQLSVMLAHTVNH
ncbi:DNA-3-methyladenine glycosylase I, partial [Pseudomonas aeruginosa]